MTSQTNRIKPPLLSALGAAAAALCGLILWMAPPGDFWVDASYDYLFRFGSRAVTNQVTLILMDNGAFASFGQVRGQPWDRALHARLLNRLADDGCELVVFDLKSGKLLKNVGLGTAAPGGPHLPNDGAIAAGQALGALWNLTTVEMPAAETAGRTPMLTASNPQ